MTKEEARAKLRKAESNLRMVNAVLKMNEQGAHEIKEEIAKLEAIINKSDRWQDRLVQPDKEPYFYLLSNIDKGLIVDLSSNNDRSPEHAFKTQEQAELIKEKILLMQEMHAFAHVRNEGWMPDWGDGGQWKHGLTQKKDKIEGNYFYHYHANSFVFGVAVKSKAIAEEMLEIFGERITNLYNKMY